MLAVELRSSPTWPARRLSLVRTYVRTFIAVRLAKSLPARQSFYPVVSLIIYFLTTMTNVQIGSNASSPV